MNAAALVDLLDRQLGAVQLRLAHEGEVAGDVLQQSHFQRDLRHWLRSVPRLHEQGAEQRYS